MNQPILICFAVKEEADPFCQLAAFLHDVRVVLTGIGAANARAAVQSALQLERPRCVISAGFAGGLCPDLKNGSIIASTDHDFPLREQFTAAGFRDARFFCAERVAVTVQEKSALRARTGADAVEMESEIVRALCRERRIPSATLRVISDSAHENLPLDFNALMTSANEISFARLILRLLQSPQKIPALIRLQQRTRRASAVLARALIGIVAADSPATKAQP